MKLLFALIILTTLGAHAAIDSRDGFAVERALANKLCAQSSLDNESRELCGSRSDQSGADTQAIEAGIAKTLLARIAGQRIAKSVRTTGVNPNTDYQHLIASFGGQPPQLQVTCTNSAVMKPICHAYFEREKWIGEDGFADFFHFTIDVTSYEPMTYKIVDDRSFFYTP